MRIVIDEEFAPEVLKAFNKTVDEEGYIVDQTTKQRVLSQEGEEIAIDEFAGIIPGSQIYLKSDIISLIRYVEQRRIAKE